MNLIVPSTYLCGCWASVHLRISLTKCILHNNFLFNFLHDHDITVFVKNILLTVLSELLKWHSISIWGWGKKKKRKKTQWAGKSQLCRFLQITYHSRIWIFLVTLKKCKGCVSSHMLFFTLCVSLTNILNVKIIPA